MEAKCLVGTVRTDAQAICRRMPVQRGPARREKEGTTKPFDDR